MRDWSSRAGRTTLVPSDIVAVQRRSPLSVRKRTPWRPQPDGEVRTERAGARDWFSDRLFVEAQQGHRRAGYGASIALHVGSAVVLFIVLGMRAGSIELVTAGSPLVTPTTMALIWLADLPPVSSQPVEPSAPTASWRPPAAAPAAGADVKAAAPLEAPVGIEPEKGAERAVDGIEGGVAGGIVGGQIDGVAAAGASSPGPLRVGGGGIKPPRKIKHVKPVYPQSALSDQARGTVVIEATIGADGTVQAVTVVHSVPALDRAALDAVRQWEYEPSRLNGAPVAVMMTVVVNFAIQ